jgi:hypothetical protein
MTESQWWSAQGPQEMLAALQATGKASDRKLRLFAAACCRNLRRLVPAEGGGGRALAVSERFADGLATREELKAARKLARSCEVAAARLDAYQAAQETVSAATYQVRWLAIDFQGRDPILAGYTAGTKAASRLAAEQSSEQVALLRDIFGNPFRPAKLAAAALSWNGGCVVKLATAIYQERAFGPARMGVLADALEEAGLSDGDILSHCRGSGPHVLGCFVVDLVLGKS